MRSLESIVERAADVLELVATDLTDVSTKLFIEDGEPRRRKTGRIKDELQALIKRLGLRNMTTRESLLSLSRLSRTCARARERG